MHFIHFMEIDAAVRWIEDWFEGFLCSIYERMLLNWTVVLCLFWDCCNIVVTIWRFMSCKRLSVSHFSNMQAGRYLTTLCINVAGFMFVYTEINTDLQFFPSGQTSNCFQNTKVPKWPFFCLFASVCYASEHWAQLCVCWRQTCSHLSWSLCSPVPGNHGRSRAADNDSCWELRRCVKLCWAPLPGRSQCLRWHPEILRFSSKEQPFGIELKSILVIGFSMDQYFSKG